MDYSRAIMAVLNDDVAAATEGASVDECPTVAATMRVFEKVSAEYPPAEPPSAMQLRKISGQLIAEVVTNPWPQSFNSGDKVMVIQLSDRRWVIVNGGSSSNFNSVVFEIAEAGGYYAGSAPDQDGEDCPEDDDYPTDLGEIKASVLKVTCGNTSIPGKDENDLILLTDPIGWLNKRTPDELIGAKGIASYMQDPDAAYGECEWVIEAINLSREVIVVTDWIKEDGAIRVKFERIRVLDNCKLPDYVLELANCTPPYGFPHCK